MAMLSLLILSCSILGFAGWASVSKWGLADFTHLRQKIEADSSKPRLIKTEPGIGCRFEPSD